MSDQKSDDPKPVGDHPKGGQQDSPQRGPGQQDSPQRGPGQQDSPQRGPGQQDSRNPSHPNQTK